MPRHFVPTTDACASHDSRLYLFSFNCFTPHLAARHSVSLRRAAIADRLWGLGENAQWPCGSLSFTLKLRFGKMFCKGFKMCRWRCHCWAVVKSPELKINQSARRPMIWLLIPKRLVLFPTFPEALLLCLLNVPLHFDTPLQVIIIHNRSDQDLWRRSLIVNPRPGLMKVEHK